MHLLIAASTGHFIVNENGEIVRYGTKKMPTGNWKFLGIRSRTSIHDRYSFSGLIEKLRVGPEPLWSYKNGKPVWLVEDEDAGSFRTWGAALHKIILVDD